MVADGGKKKVYHTLYINRSCKSAELEYNCLYKFMCAFGVDCKNQKLKIKNQKLKIENRKLKMRVDVALTFALDGHN